MTLKNRIVGKVVVVVFAHI